MITSVNCGLVCMHTFHVLMHAEQAVSNVPRVLQAYSHAHMYCNFWHVHNVTPTTNLGVTPPCTFG